MEYIDIDLLFILLSIVGIVGLIFYSYLLFSKNIKTAFLYTILTSFLFAITCLCYVFLTTLLGKDNFFSDVLGNSLFVLIFFVANGKLIYSLENNKHN